VVDGRSVLVVVAHPDDEALGCGGTVAKLRAGGSRVSCCIMGADVRARRHRPEDDALRADTDAAAAILGFERLIRGDFPNIELNTVPHLELVRFVEEAMLETGADVLITHHAGDLNNDHRHVALAARAAARLWQRREGVPPLWALLYMEIASSTDWAFSGRDEVFAPNLFVPLGEAELDAKLRACAAYRGVMRPHPHPRSEEGLRAQALRRGAQAGAPLAEAFETAFLRADW